MRKKLAVWTFICLLLSVVLPVTAEAGWKKTSEGKMYTTSGSPGYYTGWKTIGGAKYYFSSKGIMATGWETIDGAKYYFGSNGKMRTGWRTISKKKYYFGDDGKMRTGWETLKSGDKTVKYYFSAKGVMQTGLQTISKKKYYFSEDGILQRGFIKAGAGKTYYGDEESGVLAQDKWIGGEYYFKEDCTMAVNEWVSGKWCGADGRYTGVQNNVGWVTEKGITCYYDRSGKKVTGWLTLSNKKYYLRPSDGARVTGWFTVGAYKYFAKDNGVVQTGKWKGKKYLQNTGAMATGWLTVDGKRYYFDPQTGDRTVGWATIGNATYYFNSKGVKQVSSWINKSYYVDATGARVDGVQKIDGKYYYFSQTNNGVLLKGWIKYSTSLYHADKTTGELSHEGWFSEAGYKYYAGDDCRLYTGLKTINKTLYYFLTSNGRMVKRAIVNISGDKYYFDDSGIGAVNTWQKINSKYYYFGTDGKMAVSQQIGSYYVGPDGARVDKEPTLTIKTKDGKKYCYDSEGNMYKGWQTVDKNKYYFGSGGAAVSGLKTIEGKKYYFFPTCILATDQVLAVGNKEYTINSSGVVTAERTLEISGNTKGSEIARFAVKYIGNPYVWGGVSLTNGADCSGFVQTVFANFGIKLLRVADDQMKGPDTAHVEQGYKKAVNVSVEDMLPGDLIFYGSANYASHVAIYIGDDKIVHASNSQPYPAGGIKISNYDYNTPVRIVRYWS